MVTGCEKEKQEIESRCKQKGFTLIELLAVIVILAVIALIATPIIVGVINKAKKNSFMDTAYGVVEAGKLYYAKNLASDTFGGKNFNFNEETKELGVSGEKPDGGTFLVSAEGQMVMAVYDKAKNWCAKKEYNQEKITVEKYNEKDCVAGRLPRKIEFDTAKGVNKPLLFSDMTPVVWNGTEFVETTKEDAAWYDYSNKKWANARTKDGSYWVWIPRYAYKITSGFHSNQTGTIDIKFLKGTTNETVDGTKIETTGYTVGTKDTSTNYFLQPAFAFEDSNAGFWMAKYEPTAAEGVTTVTGGCKGDNVTNKTVKIVPNATSWRCINVNNAYTVSKNMKDKEAYGWMNNEVDTHLIKNTEWGAVSYLSKSQYGANTEEVWNNTYKQFQTGCSGISVSSASEDTCTQYSTANGQKASTTHNIYGVYDMSGGAIERTASYVNNDVSYLSDFGASLKNEKESKYKNVYSKGTGNTAAANYEANKNVYGDAVYETSNAADGDKSWYNDYSIMPSSNPFFTRSNDYSGGGSSGVFTFNGTAGNDDVYYSFRPVAFPL
ncbi:MAG: type II secretion system protein [Bacilli bacterium]|nr:type II secretion system protein [Bacilli bacterium]